MAGNTNTVSIHHSLFGSLCGRLGRSRVVQWFSTRTRRRGLVVGFGAILAAFPIAGWLIDQMWVTMLVLIPYMGGSLLLAATGQYLLDRPLRSLDERQRQVRQSIFASPYAVGAAVGLAGGLVLARALDAQSEASTMGWTLVVIGFVVGLPSMMLVWKLPEPIDDETD